MVTATFRSRARVIDLLGRQQIADTPTAIGELFKNSLDAGATNVWADYRPDDKLISFRDDGLGMRLHDVLEKWLVLATDSRYKPVDDGWAKYATEEQKEWLKKPSYGEKGIGRLSVASLGRMTLLWTVWGQGKEKRGTLCLVHWHMFQHPSKLFEELPIPCLELDSAPSVKTIQDLFATLQTSQTVESMLADRTWDKQLQRELSADIAINITEVLPPDHFHWENGTTFFVFGAPDNEISVLFGEEMDDNIEPRSDYLKSFHAFATFWDPFHVIKDRPFKIHSSVNGKLLKRTNPQNQFWAPEDFDRCDHHIMVDVDANGFAEGFIKNYDGETIIYKRQLPQLPRRSKSPGAFKIEIGYVQGKKEDSPLPDDLHKEMDSRLTLAGGFSIYINNVRIQPYGSLDSDFAGFEQRRLKNAGRYYFSMNRMFGGVFIADKSTTDLREKAGREGFIINSASKGLRFRIEEIFVDIADSFLGSKSNRPDKRERREAKEKKATEERLKKEKKEYLERILYAQGWLRSFSDDIKRQVLEVRDVIAKETDSIPGTYINDCRKGLNQLNWQLAQLHEAPSQPPEGVTIDDDSILMVDAYNTKRDIEIRNLSGEIAKLASRIQTLMLRASLTKEQERAIAHRIITSEKILQDNIRKTMAEAQTKAKTLGTDLADIEAEAVKELNRCRDNLLEGLTFQSIANDTTGENARKLEEALQAQTQLYEHTIAPRLRTIRDEILHLTSEAGGMFILSEQAEELSRLKERNSFLIDMAQLGLVFETANHEHEEHVALVRNSIKHLRKTLTEEQNTILSLISQNFDIIDERIRMFDPLLRRRSSVYENITGEEIEQFLINRFAERLNSANITAEFTDAFRKSVWKRVKRPNFLGALHNLFLNSTYWCCQGMATRDIKFALINSCISISDSGPGIVVRDKERIFEPGFSRRPGGRGLGLYIAKESFSGMGYVLTYSETPITGILTGANFLICKKEDTENE